MACVGVAAQRGIARRTNHAAARHGKVSAAALYQLIAAQKLIPHMQNAHAACSTEAGWFLVGKFCFKAFEAASLTYWQAAAWCTALGPQVTLAQFEGIRDLQQLATNVSFTAGSQFWIGFERHDIGESSGSALKPIFRSGLSGRAIATAKAELQVFAKASR